MRFILVALFLFSLGNAGDLEMFYDDGTPASIVTGSILYGVWFHTDDFFPASSQVLLSSVEMWFYEHSSYPWDTSAFYLDIWSGNETGPVGLLYSSLQTALHNVPILIDISQEDIVVDSDFWILENTELSTGGWPSPTMDPSPPSVPHSCGSGGWLTAGDLLFRCSADELSLDAITWGALKAVF